MSIEIRPSGEAQSQALAGEIIGKGKARERFAEDVRIANARAAQEAMQQKAMDWEAQKMQMRSAQEFAQELRLGQARLNAEARAKEWEVEKMEMISQADFAQEERVRTEKYGRFSDTMTYIDDLEQQGIYSKEQIADMKFRAALPYEKDGFKEVSQVLGEHDAVMRLQEQQEKQEYGLKPAAYEYLSEEERQQAAKIQTGLDTRPTNRNLEFDRIKQLDQVTAIMDDFEENGDINEGWGTAIVPLAVKDSKGKLTEATPAQKQLYESSKLLLGQLSSPSEVVTPDYVKTDADKETYQILINKGWTPEAIRTALGK